MRYCILLLMLAGVTFHTKVSAQNNVGVKTNLLYGGYTYTPNLGIEFGLSRHATLELLGGYNPWNLNSDGGMKKSVHFLVQPEFRYFFRQKFSGHFLGIHGLYSQYNIGGQELPLLFGKGSEDYRFEGSAYGGGISYGYQFRLGRHWNLEVSAGAGVMLMDYGKYDCVNCGRKLSSHKKTYFGPTKASISVIYLLRGTEKAKRKKKPGKGSYAHPGITQNASQNAMRTLRQDSVAQPAKVYIPHFSLPATPVSMADSLAKLYPFVVSMDNFESSRESQNDKLFDPDMPLNMGKGQSAPQQSAVEQFVANNEKGAIQINFNRSTATIDRYYMENNMSLVTLASVLKKIEKSVDSRVDKVVLAGFSSPDGLLANNDRLAWERADALRSFIRTNSAIPMNKILIYNGSEDWRGLRALVEESDIENKYGILQIIDQVPIVAGRERRLMELSGGRPYRRMAREFFPKLRNAAYIKVYYANMPQTPEVQAYTYRLQKAVALMEEGKYPAALSLLETESGERDGATLNLMGVCCMMTGEITKAGGYFREAIAKGNVDAKLNLEQIISEFISGKEKQ